MAAGKITMNPRDAEIKKPNFGRSTAAVNAAIKILKLENKNDRK